MAGRPSGASTNARRPRDCCTRSATRGRYQGSVGRRAAPAAIGPTAPGRSRQLLERALGSTTGGHGRDGRWSRLQRRGARSRRHFSQPVPVAPQSAQTLAAGIQGSYLVLKKKEKKQMTGKNFFTTMLPRVPFLWPIIANGGESEERIAETACAPGRERTAAARART